MKFTTSALFLVFSGYNSALAFAPTKTTTSGSTASSTQLYAESDKRRVVVTGLGVVNGVGIGHEDFFQGCLDGKSSIDHVKRCDVTYMPCKIGSEVPDDMFDPKDWFTNPKNVKSNDRYTHFAVAAARQALTRCWSR